ncbi:uncharacterized protein METZ01_LOCUS322546 [marine metagenome]|uniref:Uncharacterized protein n=1 Tax=marine metagenome TaxID=408172 RepID=A0A382PCP2_9ZZZZ
MTYGLIKSTHHTINKKPHKSANSGQMVGHDVVKKPVMFLG